jgi:N6-L-threonylcarbamoyladenine synthase
LPLIGIHHLEAHLLSPLMTEPAPPFPFVALLVSGGHSQLMRVDGIGRYAMLGETLDDAAGEAFDKTAKLLGLGYPGGPALAKLAENGRPGRFRLPRPLQRSTGFDFSFSGLKTAVSTLLNRSPLPLADQADLAAEIQEAITDVLVTKAVAAVRSQQLEHLVVAGGVGANKRLRTKLDALAAAHEIKVYYPPLEFCTDNGAMVAFAGALRLSRADKPPKPPAGFNVRPRWDLADLS